MTTVYFAGTEDVSYIAVNGFAPSTNGSFFRSAFSRCSMQAGNIANTTLPIANFINTPEFGPVTSFWVHGIYYNNTSFNTSNGSILLVVADAAGLPRLLVRGTGTAGQVKISTVTTAGVITDLVTSAAGLFTSAYLSPGLAFDLFINYAVAGQCTLYLNGAVIVDTGAGVNVTTNSVTALGQVQYGGLLTSTTVQGWHECLVQDTTTLGCAVLTLPPVASGATQSWTPNTVGDINEVAINDVNFISTISVNALSEWTVSTTMPPGAWTIEAIVQAARVLVGTTGPQHFEWLVRTTDGTDHVVGSVAPLTSFGNFSNVWPTNPHTSAAWAAGDLIQAGIESLT